MAFFIALTEGGGGISGSDSLISEYSPDKLLPDLLTLKLEGVLAFEDPLVEEVARDSSASCVNLFALAERLDDLEERVL